MKRLVKAIDKTKVDKQIIIDELCALLGAKFGTNVKTDLKSRSQVEAKLNRFMEAYNLEEYKDEQKSTKEVLNFGYATIITQGYSAMWVFEELGINVKFYIIDVDVYTTVYLIGVFEEY